MSLRSRRERARPAFVIAAAFGLVLAASAQRPAPRYYFGEQLTVLRTFVPRGTAPGSFGFYPGFGVRFGFSSNPIVALEAELDYMPARGRQLFTDPGVDVTELSVGLRPGYRWRRFGLFYKIAPGLIDFGHDINYDYSFPPASFSFGPRDRLGLMVENAGVFEYFVTRRYALRVDVADVFLSFERPGYPGSLEEIPPSTADDYHNLQLSVGVVFRIWR